MSDDVHDPTSARARFLPAFLGTGLTIFLVAFLILVTGGFLFYVVLAIGFVTLVGWLQYRLWGRALEEATASERNAEELRERTRFEERDRPSSFRR